MPDGPRLLALQELDTLLDQLAHQRPRLAEVAAHSAAQQAVQQVDAELLALRTQVADADRAILEAESSATALTAKRTRLEQQLKTVIAPREAEALMHEIDLLTAQRGELDDVELEAMERQQAAEHGIAEASARREQLQASLDEATSARDAAWQALDGRIAELRDRRSAAATDLSAADVQWYEAARPRFAGIAVARLDGLRCTGCHLDLSRAEVDAMKSLPADELAECPQCNRALVR